VSEHSNSNKDLKVNSIYNHLVIQHDIDHYDFDTEDSE